MCEPRLNELPPHLELLLRTSPEHQSALGRPQLVPVHSHLLESKVQRTPAQPQGICMIYGSSAAPE
jgi:hypothetical protein